MAAKKPAAAAPAAEAPAAGGKKKTLIILIAAVVLTGGLVGGGMFFMLGSKADSKPAAEHGDEESAEGGEHGDEEFEDEEAGHAGAPAVFVKLTPPFIVNLADAQKQRFLQADVSIQSSTEGAEALLEHAMPVVRNALLLLFSQQSYDALVTREGKEALQAQALIEVRAALRSAKVKVKVDKVLFTSLVMQ